MAVKLRLKRMGSKQRPFYRIVAADARFPRDGRFIETVGTYDPIKGKDVVTIDEEKALKWLNNGAQPTDTVRNILSKNGVSYVYDSVYKDRLMSVGNYITFEYNSSSPLFPTKITKGNNVFNLVWNTNRLESVNDISFIYDHFIKAI